MRICLVTPTPARSRKGNRVTATRWGRMLRDLGHRVAIEEAYSGARCDLLVALHARRSARSIRDFRERHPECPLIVVLTGTDLYRDIRTSAAAQHSLEVADRLVVLHPLGTAALPRRLRKKARVVVQSAVKTRARVERSRRTFDVCVIGHLRPVKDPFRTAMASRQLPLDSRIRVLHLGAALSRSMERRARAECRSNPRYHWYGDRPAWRARYVLARSRVLVLSSIMEGAANVLSEALAAGVPVLASSIAGTVGILGRDYPGYFAVRDTRRLLQLLRRVEIDRKFHERLRQRCRALAPLVQPHHELRSWADIVEEFADWKSQHVCVH